MNTQKPLSEQTPASPGPEDQLAERREQRRGERVALVEEMEELKNEKLRRQLEEMRAEMRGPAEKGEEQQAESSPPPVQRARTKPRHFVTALSFVVLVLLPIALTAWYLWTRAEDRYVSQAGFSVRTEEIGSAFELLGGVAEISGSSSSDTDILYKFIQSPELAAAVDRRLDLRSLWAKADPSKDPIFAYHPPGTIEDLTDYWNRMVAVYSDSGTGLIDLEVQAFTPEDAKAIATAIYEESSDMINRLSAIARNDATRYAREELDQAVERLKEAREALTRFRNENQIVDPSASIQGQMGILSSLQAELATTLIDLDILRQTANPNDPRITQGERRVEVINKRIAEERRKLGIGVAVEETPPGSRAFADVMGEFERLIVDLEFAEQSYTSALSAYDTAVAEARRQSRYLAAHVNPTLPESATEPERFQLLGLVSLFLLVGWSVLVLVGYSLRDRR